MVHVIHNGGEECITCVMRGPLKLEYLEHTVNSSMDFTVLSHKMFLCLTYREHLAQFRCFFL